MNAKRTNLTPEELEKALSEISSDSPEQPIRTPDGRNLAAVLLGRRGGLKGGRARAERLPPEERRRIARAAAQARWSKNEAGND